MDSALIAIDGPGTRALARPAPDTALAAYLRGQVVANGRAALLLRPFTDTEFGTGAAAPSSAHILEVNTLLGRVRRLVEAKTEEMARAAARAIRAPERGALDAAMTLKQEGAALVSANERIRQVYWDIFGQRLTRIAPQLLASDRIALDCYQYVYGGLGKARSIPSPAPFSYMEAGVGPATFRRGVALRKLGRLANPFPLVKLPYSRLVTPWTLGAIPHEIGHNLHSDLGLWLAVPRLVNRRLAAAGLPQATRRVWVRWTKETFADLIGVLLIGPAFVASLMDVVGKSPRATGAFNPRGVHPTPYLRVAISLDLLRRIGFPQAATRFDGVWKRLYPPSVAQGIPAGFLRDFERSLPIVVETIAETAYPQLGGKTLRGVVSFRPQDHAVASEAAGRLARGRDPGIVPERFLINAARIAFDRRLAPPGVIARHFYDALGRR